MRYSISTQLNSPKLRNLGRCGILNFTTNNFGGWVALGPQTTTQKLQIVQSVRKWLKNVARAFWVPIFLTRIVCDLWNRGLPQRIPCHTYSRARRLHSYLERPWC